MRGLALLSGLLLPVAAQAQTWTRDGGSGYVELGVRHLAGDRVYGPDRVAHELPTTYRQLSLGFYGELGVVDRWLTVALTGEALRRNQLDDQGRTQGLGDLKVGLASGLLVAPVRLTAQLYVGLPTGDSAPDGGADPDGAAIARSLPTGDGELDLEPRLSLGLGFGGGESWPLEHYLVSTVGVNVSVGDLPPTILAQLELGTRLPWPVLDRVWWIVRLGVAEAIGGGGAAPSPTGLVGGASYVSVGGEARVRVAFGLSAFVGIETAARARNVVAARPIRAGLGLEF